MRLPGHYVRSAGPTLCVMMCASLMAGERLTDYLVWSGYATAGLWIVVGVLSYGPLETMYRRRIPLRTWTLFILLYWIPALLFLYCYPHLLDLTAFRVILRQDFSLGSAFLLVADVTVPLVWVWWYIYWRRNVLRAAKTDAVGENGGIGPSPSSDGIGEDCLDDHE